MQNISAMLQMQSTPDTSASLPNKTMTHGKESTPENDFSKILQREVSGKRDRGNHNDTPVATKSIEKKIQPEKTASPQSHSNHPAAPKHERSPKMEHPRQHAAHATPTKQDKPVSPESPKQSEEIEKTDPDRAIPLVTSESTDASPASQSQLQPGVEPQPLPAPILPSTPTLAENAGTTIQPDNTTMLSGTPGLPQAVMQQSTLPQQAILLAQDTPSATPATGGQVLMPSMPVAQPAKTPQQPLASSLHFAADSESLGSMNVTTLLNDAFLAEAAANSAVDGNLLPFDPDSLSDTLRMSTTEPALQWHEDSLASSSLSLTQNHAHVPAPTTANTPAHDIKVDLPVGQPKWNTEFAQKVVWLTNQQQQVAEIRLNPAHLGPVEVMLTISQDQATAQFSSPHLAVRDAIEQALPRLREMMADSGIQLGNVTVGADSFQQEHRQQQGQHATPNQSFHLSDGKSETGLPIDTSSPVRHVGIVNTYA